MKGVFGAFMALFIIGVALVDWRMLLVIPMAVGNGWINATAIKKNKFGKPWHYVQYTILLGTLGVLFWKNILFLDELLITVAFYYTFFEVSLNLFRGVEWDYTGRTSTIDKLMRKVFKTPATLNAGFMAVKLLLTFAGIAVYLFNKPF